MSKQNIGKGNPSARPSNQAGKSGGSVPPSSPPKTNGAQARPNANTRPGSTAANTAARRPSATTTGARNTQAKTAVKRKSGFRLRPLDIALLVVGVLVIGFIVMSALQAPVQRVDANAQVPTTATHVPVGNVAPDFDLPSVEGKNYKLSDQKGKVVVLEFMATWCPHCQDDAPMMNQLDAAYKSKGVQIFGINATPRGHNNVDSATMDDLKWFRDTYAVTFPLLFDKQLKSANDYGVLGYPSVYILDKENKVIFQPPTDALPTYDQLAAALDKALK